MPLTATSAASKSRLLSVASVACVAASIKPKCRLDLRSARGAGPVRVIRRIRHGSDFSSMLSGPSRSLIRRFIAASHASFEASTQTARTAIGSSRFLASSAFDEMYETGPLRPSRGAAHPRGRRQAAAPKAGAKLPHSTAAPCAIGILGYALPSVVSAGFLEEPLVFFGQRVPVPTLASGRVRGRRLAGTKPAEHTVAARPTVNRVSVALDRATYNMRIFAGFTKATTVTVNRSHG